VVLVGMPLALSTTQLQALLVVLRSYQLMQYQLPIMVLLAAVAAVAVAVAGSWYNNRPKENIVCLLLKE
jgi:hypothetical protein